MNDAVHPALQDRLSAYLDAALPQVERAEVEAMARTPGAVSDELTALRQADAAIRSAFDAMLEAPVPLSLVRAIQLAPEVPSAPVAANLPHAPRRIVANVAAAFALLMIGAAAGSFVTRSLSGDPVQTAAAAGWLRQVADYHLVYARQKRHLVEVPAAEADHVQSWLADSTGVRFAIPDLTAQGLTFQGARLLVAAGKPVGQLMYTDAAGQVVAVCFIAGGNAGSDGTPSFARQGFDGVEMVKWATRDASFVVVGPPTGIDLQTIAQVASETL